MNTEHQVTRITLICGFLGAGKTTFIRNQLLDEQQNTFVLVNEFGALGFDGALIQEKDGLQVLEMPGGCICCSQKHLLPEELTKIIENYTPQRIFIEPSGVAKASEVIEIVNTIAVQDHVSFDGVITIIDGETFLEYSSPDVFGSFFLDQLCHADIILLNKADLISSSLLQEIEKRIETITGGTLVVPTSYSKIEASLPQGRNNAPQLQRPMQILPRAQHLAPQPSWEYLCLTPTSQFSMERIVAIMEELQNGRYGNIFRAKGFLLSSNAGKEDEEQLLQIQLVSKRANVTKAESNHSPRLTCIGFNLKRDLLEACFNDSCNAPKLSPAEQ